MSKLLIEMNCYTCYDQQCLVACLTGQLFRRNGKTAMLPYIRYIKKILMRIILFPLRALPIRKTRVLLLNNLSGRFAGNPKFVANYLGTNFDGQLELIYVVFDPERYQEFNMYDMKFVGFNSIRYFYYAMTSKIFLTNSMGYSYIPLRKSQLVINTFHGGGAYKKIGIHMYEDTRIFRKDLKLSAEKTDIILSTCRRFTDNISKATLVPRDRFWEIGMPRNDNMFNASLEERRNVRENLGLADNDRLVLFAPTYRKPNDNYFKDSISIAYGIDSDRVKQALKQRFGGEWKFGYRLHPAVANRVPLPGNEILDFSDYEDIQDLLMVADVLINDFSSSMWDYMLTERPGFIFALDLDHYIRTTEVYTPVADWPFPVATSNDQLVENILTFDESVFRKACQKHYNDMGGCETGKATQLVCQKILETCSPNLSNTFKGD